MLDRGLFVTFAAAPRNADSRSRQIASPTVFSYGKLRAGFAVFGAPLSITHRGSTSWPFTPPLSAL